MSFSAFIRDTAYFQIRRDQQMVMNAEDFDLQFNKIVNYINTKIVPIVNNLGGNNIAGTNEPNTANTFLRNIGDGTTEWAPINNNAINDYSIAFSKIIRTPPNAIGSVFATGADRAFRLVAPSAENQALVSRNNNLPVWQKLKSENFFDRALDGAKINYAAIGLEHLGPEVTGRDVDDNAIFSRHIQDQTITGLQLADGILSEIKVSQALLDARKNNHNSNIFAANFVDLEGRHIANGLLNSIYLAQRDNGLDTNDINKYTFTPDNIADGSMTSIAIGGAGQASNATIADGAVLAQHLIANSFEYFDFTNAGYLNFSKIRKEKLNAAIRAKLGI